MGCNSSKDNVSVIKSSSQAWTDERNAANNNKKPTSAGSRKGSGKKQVTIKSQDSVEILAEDGLIKTDRSGSQHSLRSENGNFNRGVSSATSKMSTHTFDSGLEEDMLPNMITEDSTSDQQQIADNNRPPTPDLDVVGTQIQSRKSSSKSIRQGQSSKDILNGLRSDGLLAAFGKKQGGMSFEVMIAPEFGILNKPPARLTSLKKIKRKKKTLTKEELEAKMVAAEERRKRKEAKMIAKLNTSAKELAVHKVATIVEKEQKDLAEEKLTKTLDKAAANREAHFKALKEKMEQKKKHAERVRLAKLERLAENKPAEEDEASAV